MNRLDALFELHAADPSAFAIGYLTHLIDVLKRLDVRAIGRVMTALDECRRRGAHIYFIGNGGSAATASHFANDLGVGMRAAGKPFRAVSLTDNVAVLTCVANDQGYENIFLRQLELVLKPGDVLVAISASGNSPSVLRAIEHANEQGNTTIGLVGFDGGAMKSLCKIVVHVETSRGEYGPVEDVHMVLDHLMASYFARAPCADR